MSLLEAVRALLSSDLPDDRDEYLTDGIEDDQPQVVQDVVNAACEELIVKGQPNRYAMAKLKEALSGEANVWVGPGETDSFGWLSGVIYTPKGMVVYG